MKEVPDIIKNCPDFESYNKKVEEETDKCFFQIDSITNKRYEELSEKGYEATWGNPNFDIAMERLGLSPIRDVIIPTSTKSYFYPKGTHILRKKVGEFRKQHNVTYYEATKHIVSDLIKICGSIEKMFTYLIIENKL